MKKIKLTIEVEVDESLYNLDEEEKLWLENEILIGNRTLYLHSNEIGDEIGVVTLVKNIQYL
jgi:hypothetical protein